MGAYVLGFQEIDKTKLALVGGKGANLGELSRIQGISVPQGFCVTTEAYQRIVAQAAGLDALLEQLSHLKPDDRERIGEISARIRGVIEQTPIAPDIEEAVDRHLAALGEHEAYAVRSSATAEDLPTASFAGQQDTYLNIIGKEAILKYISRCWASLFTDRAVIYRLQNGFDHSRVHLSVVIQKMVFPEVSGILFTADPITSDRRVVSIDASFGLGEALVSGLVDADIYKVRDGEIVDRKISAKKLAIYASKDGGTTEQRLESDRQNRQALTDEQILRLERIGRQIEAHFGRPQDIEWCLYEGQFYIVQSRPITTLYPLPKVDDGKGHVYLSLGHQQMMTDAMKPLGMSLFPIWLKKITNDPMAEAGGRVFLDVSYELTSATAAQVFVQGGLGSADPLIQKALTNVLKRKAYLKTVARGKTTMGLSGGSLGQVLAGFRQARKIERENDPRLLHKIMDRQDALLRDLEQRIAGKTGADLFDFILRDMDEAYASIVLDNYGVGIIGAFAPNWIKKHMKKWLGEEDVTDALTQSLANNVTAEMGLELLDVADVARQYPAVLAWLPAAQDQTFFEELDKLEGGKAVGDALRDYLGKYGARCPGEIDMTRPRWAEQPTMLVPLILNNIQNFAPGSHAILFEQRLREAQRKEDDLLARIEKLPGGARKAAKAKRKISVMRNFVGFREYPKYAMMRHMYVYKQALLREAAGLAQRGLIKEPEDIYYLSFEGLRTVVATGRLDDGIIAQRKADYEVFAKLTPPRVMTSDGEVIPGEYDGGDSPKGALLGVPVSAGVIEGRARVVTRLEDAKIEEGDILVTAFTDPSWTPLFVSIKGLVAEVGGMMTHGAVVAREYGLPAVVSVENATGRIKDGQRIRVNGTKGYVEILD